MVKPISIRHRIFPFLLPTNLSSLLLALLELIFKYRLCKFCLQTLWSQYIIFITTVRGHNNQGHWQTFLYRLLTTHFDVEYFHFIIQIGSRGLTELISNILSNLYFSCYEPGKPHQDISLSCLSNVFHFSDSPELKHFKTTVSTCLRSDNLQTLLSTFY